MSIDEQIFLALVQSDPNDLPAIRRYIAWVKMRRQIHNHFYMFPHWILPHKSQEPKKYHWVGK